MAQFELHYLPFWTSDTVTNDSDKTITVPAKKIWQINSIKVAYTTNATGGTRQLEIEIQSETGASLWPIQPGISQADSLVYTYTFSPSLGDLVGLRDSVNITTPIPVLVMAPGWKIRVYDNKAITPTGSGETMNIYITGLQATIGI
jgi:hypothetical protein